MQAPGISAACEPARRTPEAHGPGRATWRFAILLLAFAPLLGASRTAAAQSVLDLARGKWTTGMIGECRYRYYYWSVNGDTMQFRDQSGQVDIERIIDADGNTLEAATVDSDHNRRGERTGTRWFYRFSRGGDIVRVSSSTGKSFTLTRCP